MEKLNNVIESHKHRTNYLECFSEYETYVNNKDKSLLNIICFNIKSVIVLLTNCSYF